jgi:hypothetical protein
VIVEFVLNKYQPGADSESIRSVSFMVNLLAQLSHQLLEREAALHEPVRQQAVFVLVRLSQAEQPVLWHSLVELARLVLHSPLASPFSKTVLITHYVLRRLQPGPGLDEAVELLHELIEGRTALLDFVYRQDCNCMNAPLF